MYAEKASEIIVVRLEPREEAHIEKALQQTGRTKADKAAFLIRAALKEAKATLQRNDNP